MNRELTVVRAADVAPPESEEARWLIEGLWGAGAVGVIGGAPKSCKSWLTLEMAVAVASGRPCLGQYAVAAPGTALVYAAEDAPAQVRDRLDHLARARGTALDRLDVRLIVEPSLRLDRGEDVASLRTTLERHRPRLLVLDPYVRLQRVDENDATAVSGILTVLRELSRTFGMAIALVHHARKGSGDSPGEGLRGSSDFHAWGDSNLYLRRHREGIQLSIEHRASASPPPILLALTTEAGSVRLDVRQSQTEAPLADRVVELLSQRGPSWQEPLREHLRVRTQDLIDTLRELQAAHRVVRTPQGWQVANGR